MQPRTGLAIVFLSFALLIAGLPATLAQTGDDAGDNGLVYMVHGHFEPAVTDEIPPPPAHEAFAATQDDGEIVLYVIPYSVETQAPVSLEAPSVTIDGPLPDQSLEATPREGTTDDQRCVDETSIEGHEGDVSDCLVVEVDADEMSGWGAVDIVLEGTHDGEPIQEAYSSAAHVAMHTTMEDGAPGWDTADSLSAVPTPFLIEDQVDPVA